MRARRATFMAAGIACALLTGLIAARTPAQDALAIGGPFALTDSTGKTVTDRDFRGRWMLVYFGYTHCPDACPTTLSNLAAAIDKLPPEKRSHVAPIFITIDPERDTPSVVGDFARAFGPEFTGLTGSVTTIKGVEHDFRVYAGKRPLKDGGYAMDHSSIIYVMDQKGQFAVILDDQLPPAEIAARLVKLGV